MKRIDEILVIFRGPPIHICMLVTEVLPCNIIIQQLAPVYRYLGCSCKGLGIIDKGEHLREERPVSMSTSMRQNI